MYGKLFASMYDGTLASVGPWEAMVTFQQLIILADKEGVVDMTAQAISRRTTIPHEIITKGIDELRKPDPDSRSPEEEGRRIVLVSDARDWGWRIVNYEYYRKIRTADERRDYMRQYQKERRARQHSVNNCKLGKQNKPIAEAEAEAEAEVEVGIRSDDIASKPPIKRQTQWPKDLVLTDKLRARAESYWKKMQVALDVEAAWEKFSAHHHAKGSMFKDWEAAWQTWYVSQVDYAKNGRGGVSLVPKERKFVY